RRRSLAPAVSLAGADPRVFVVWLGAVSMTPPGPSSALPPGGPTSGCPSRHFGENQLSPGSFSISPLSTAPPPHLHLRCVRASTGHYPRFTLAMDSSPGFGSTAGDLFRRPLQTRSRCGCATPVA